MFLCTYYCLFTHTVFLQFFSQRIVVYNLVCVVTRILVNTSPAIAIVLVFWKHTIPGGTSFYIA